MATAGASRWCVQAERQLSAEAFRARFSSSSLSRSFELDAAIELEPLASGSDAPPPAAAADPDFARTWKPWLAASSSSDTAPAAQPCDSAAAASSAAKKKRKSRAKNVAEIIMAPAPAPTAPPLECTALLGAADCAPPPTVGVVAAASLGEADAPPIGARAFPHGAAAAVAAAPGPAIGCMAWHGRA